MFRSLCFGALLLAAQAVDVSVDVFGLTVVGRAVESDSGVTIDEFLGIPYATADRWAGPTLVDTWNGTLEAKVYGATCPGSLCLRQSEDCLHLNIYRPSQHQGAALPVVLYIHGGMHSFGCSNVQAGAQFVARGVTGGNDFIFVSINYRLGAFGFLGSSQLTAADGSTGNFGFQDQRAAIQWVRKYIGAFGGDENQLTLMGLSAGASCITAHMVAPKSQGLFGGAVCQSGLGNVRGAKPMSNAEQVFEGMLAASGCTDTACLKGLSTADVLAAQNSMSAFGQGDYATWSPVIDGVEFTEHPWTSFNNGQFAPNLQVLAGTARDDYALFVLQTSAIPADLTRSQFMAIMADYIPEGNKVGNLLKMANLYSDRSDYPAVLGEYSMWWWALMRALTDRSFLCPTIKTLGNLKSTAKSVYTYRFDHPSQTDVGTTGTGLGNLFALHGSDSSYAYNCSRFPRTCEFDFERESVLAEDMSGFWSEFVSTGSLSLPWTRFLPAIGNTLSLDVSGYTTLTHVQDEQCAFWDPILNTMYG